MVADLAVADERELGDGSASAIVGWPAFDLLDDTALSHDFDKVLASEAREAAKLQGWLDPSHPVQWSGRGLQLVSSRPFSVSRAGQ